MLTPREIPQWLWDFPTQLYSRTAGVFQSVWSKGEWLLLRLGLMIGCSSPGSVVYIVAATLPQIFLFYCYCLALVTHMDMWWSMCVYKLWKSKTEYKSNSWASIKKYCLNLLALHVVWMYNVHKQLQIFASSPEKGKPLNVMPQNSYI